MGIDIDVDTDTDDSDIDIGADIFCGDSLRSLFIPRLNRRESQTPGVSFHAFSVQIPGLGS